MQVTTAAEDFMAVRRSVEAVGLPVLARSNQYTLIKTFLCLGLQVTTAAEDLMAVQRSLEAVGLPVTTQSNEYDSIIRRFLCVVLQVITAAEDFVAVRRALEAVGLPVSDGALQYVPLTATEVGDAEFESNEKLYEGLLALEDVDNVYTTCDGLH